MKTLFSTAIRIGLSEPLSQMEMVELCRFIRKEFGDMNPDEIMHAIDLYCAQKLDFKKDTYNKMSNLFMGNVMQSFRRYRTAAMHALKKEQEEEVNKPLADQLEESLFIPYDKMRKGESYPWDELQEWLIYINLNQVGFPFATPKRKKEIMKEIRDGMSFPPKMPENKKEAKVISKAIRQCFREWVQEMALNEVDIRSKLKPTLIKIDKENEESRQKN